MRMWRWVSVGLGLSLSLSGPTLAGPTVAVVPSLAPAPAASKAPGLPALAPLPPPAAPAVNSLEGRLQGVLATSSPGLPLAKFTVGDSDDLAAAKAFYTARNFAPLWVTDAGLNAPAKRVIAEIARADDWGLKATDFTVPTLAASPAPTRDQLAEAELTLTRAVLKYARFARGGRIPDPSGELSAYLDRKPQLVAPQAILDQLAASQDPASDLKGFNPQQPQFENLRRAYLKARAEQDKQLSLRLAEGRPLMPGQSDPRIPALRKRLGIPAPASTDGFGAPIPADLYDAELVSAVRTFQRANNLRADGRIGDKTRELLNGGSDNQIAKLLANMEQWRWMPADLGATYVMINIPEFQMRLVKGGTTIHTERVVTGKPNTSTPIFSQNMQTVVFQPKWGVPDSIKINELLPRLQSGGGLRSGLKMALNGREIDPWNVDWTRADITRYQVYQPSGEDNALGVVKFLFPNRHSVYLHDTPSKSLFNASERAYSHGCVRVRNPVRLAELILNGDKGWESQRIRDLVEDGPEDNPIKLDTKIPVHITYFTATADAAGNVATFRDIYGHERRITLALAGKNDQISKLDPPPLGSPRGTNVALGDDAALYANGRRRPWNDPRFGPPAALGNPLPPVQIQQPKFSFSALINGSGGGSSTKSTGGRNWRGNSTNDVIMRQLGGF